MSNPQESNNPGSPPDLSQLNIKYTRDPNYYFSDGSATFLVDDVLFKVCFVVLWKGKFSHGVCRKFQASLLASKDSKITFKVLPYSEAETLLDPSDEPQSQLRRSDEHPIKITNIRPFEFRALLGVLIPRPENMIHKYSFEDIHDEKKRGVNLFWKFFDVGVMSVHFELADVARWAWPRVRIVLISAASKLAKMVWDKRWLQKIFVYYETILVYAQNAANELLAFFRFAISRHGGDALYMAWRPTSELDAILGLYRDSLSLSFPTSNLALGCIFVVILSLGHNSDMWKNKLTRDERSVLYIAQVHLVSLRNHPGLKLDWFHNPTDSGVLAQVCSECSQHFTLAWSESFGRLGELNSPLPLEDVSKLANLPQCRYYFAGKVRKSGRLCQADCAEKIIGEIDGHLNKVFNDQLVTIYKELAA
ncbi:hypothetical protein FRC12_003358 [Ceratobasidium sp. 428]|nr:hypothetical protein FRC12_003358 [Ceratobasidium sp. 428]